MTAAIVTGVAAIAVASAIFVNREKLFNGNKNDSGLLLSENSIDVCLQSAQKEFFDATEEAFSGLRAGYFWQRMISYFIKSS